ncbi:conserved hypothetical protein [Catenulispora acidiphila DSM 44928]|uniref:Integral membrane protein n=1 Tax=Catenulispora acidiphila (strain DSM 44928 / JCM 14897 / NBRC 102108 / NRRL B-24433 / ID139908) TaxID=479433 RepID=C7QGY8_CATAD|nr:hypothetical protein [Catenulispora acidiphila]ACU76838.1 conserved hypothetical protein [Catenulispora acidiphila DSM 44928]
MSVTPPALRPPAPRRPSRPSRPSRPAADAPAGPGVPRARRWLGRVPGAPAGRPALRPLRSLRPLHPRTDAGTAALVAVVVAVLAQIPLLTNRFFYLWDDSAAEFLPVWNRIGTDLLHGHWNPLVPGMWNGGNFAAEALFGIWNPVELLDALFTALSGDLLIAAIVIKTQFLVLLTLGIYAVCREYRAGRAAAAVVAVALPFSGFTLYFDAASWIAGLMGFAWTAHFWWSARRYMRGRLNPVVPIIFGLMIVTTGNPYGLLGMVVVASALAAESLAARDRRAIWRLAGVSAVAASAAALVFLPLVLSAAVTTRSPGSGIMNTGFLVPGVGDLLNLSAPAYLPHSVSWHMAFWSVPATYLAWFIAPLAPWLDWRRVTHRPRTLIGVGLLAVVYLAMAVGPSQIWLFRWPLRVIEYAYLGLCIVLALALTEAPRTDLPRRRAAVTAAIIVVGGYLSWSAQPGRFHTVIAATALVGVLSWLMVRRVRAGRPLSRLLIGGTVAVLGFQALAFPANQNVTNWHPQHDVASMKQHFDKLYQGNTLMVGDPLTEADRLGRRQVWHDLPGGNLLQVAGVTSLNNYTGVSYRAYMRHLCMSYYGGTCQSLFARLWHKDTDSAADLADLLRLQTVVVQTRQSVLKALNPPPPAAGKTPTKPLVLPAGWTVRELDAHTLVLNRRNALPWPNGRVSYTAPGVHVTADDIASDGVGETLRYTGSGEVRIAALLWPGWHATVDGHAAKLKGTDVGIIKVLLPPARSGGSTLKLSFQPPGYRIGEAMALLGLGLAGLIIALWYRSRRRLRAEVAGTAAMAVPVPAPASASVPAPVPASEAAADTSDRSSSTDS